MKNNYYTEIKQKKIKKQTKKLIFQSYCKKLTKKELLFSCIHFAYKKSTCINKSFPLSEFLRFKISY